MFLFLVPSRVTVPMFFQSIVKMLYIGKKLAFIPLGYLQLFYKPNQFAEVSNGNRQIQRKQ